jgi:hypothetical protein
MGLESIFGEMCARQTTPPDGLEWLPGRAAAIREDNLYGGVRLKLVPCLGNIRIPVQVDVGFGDANPRRPRPPSGRVFSISHRYRSLPTALKPALQKNSMPQRFWARPTAG